MKKNNNKQLHDEQLKGSLSKRSRREQRWMKTFLCEVTFSKTSARDEPMKTWRHELLLLFFLSNGTTKEQPTRRWTTVLVDSAYAHTPLTHKRMRNFHRCRVAQAAILLHPPLCRSLLLIYHNWRDVRRRVFLLIHSPHPSNHDPMFFDPRSH